MVSFNKMFWSHAGVDIWNGFVCIIEAISWVVLLSLNAPVIRAYIKPRTKYLKAVVPQRRMEIILTFCQPPPKIFHKNRKEAWVSLWLNLHLLSCTHNLPLCISRRFLTIFWNMFTQGYSFFRDVGAVSSNINTVCLHTAVKRSQYCGIHPWLL